jgi:hypothetical protein
MTEICLFRKVESWDEEQKHTGARKTPQKAPPWGCPIWALEGGGGGDRVHHFLDPTYINRDLNALSQLESDFAFAYCFRLSQRSFPVFRMSIR